MRTIKTTNWLIISDTGRVYALIWTPAMVMLAVPQGGSATLDADFARVLFTIVAAVAVVAVTYLVRQLVNRATPTASNGTVETAS